MVHVLSDEAACSTNEIVYAVDQHRNEVAIALIVDGQFNVEPQDVQNYQDAVEMGSGLFADNSNLQGPWVGGEEECITAQPVDDKEYELKKDQVFIPPSCNGVKEEYETDVKEIKFVTVYVMPQRMEGSSRQTCNFKLTN